MAGFPLLFFIAHFIRSLIARQGLTNGVIQLLMGSTFRFHSIVTSRGLPTDSPGYIHSALQIGGIVSCVVGKHAIR